MNYALKYVAEISIELYLVHGYMLFLIQGASIIELFVFVSTVVLFCVLHIVSNSVTDRVLKKKMTYKV